jgi:hypothetical protein
LTTVVEPARYQATFSRLAARLVTSGPAFFLGLLVEMAAYARGALRARRARRG